MILANNIGKPSHIQVTVSKSVGQWVTQINSNDPVLTLIHLPCACKARAINIYDYNRVAMLMIAGVIISTSVLAVRLL